MVSTDDGTLSRFLTQHKSFSCQCVLQAIAKTEGGKHEVDLTVDSFDLENWTELLKMYYHLLGTTYPVRLTVKTPNPLRLLYNRRYNLMAIYTALKPFVGNVGEQDLPNIICEFGDKTERPANEVTTSELYKLVGARWASKQPSQSATKPAATLLKPSPHIAQADAVQSTPTTPEQVDTEEEA